MRGILIVIVIILIVAMSIRAAEPMLSTAGRFRLGSYDPNIYGGISSPPQMPDRSSYYTA